MPKETQIADLLTAAEKVWNWQYRPTFHELTCGGTFEGKDCRSILCVGLDAEKVFLFCPRCGYVQDWIPEPVLGVNNDG